MTHVSERPGVAVAAIDEADHGQPGSPPGHAARADQADHADHAAPDAHSAAAHAAGAAPHTAVQLALQVGWTMAVLYRPAPRLSQNAADSRPQLMSVHELPAGERREVELSRLRHLLALLASLPECSTAGLPACAGGLGKGPDPFDSQLAEANLKILTALASTSPELELAYGLGRSLRDTANPPMPPAVPGADQEVDLAALAKALEDQLDRGRVSRLQDWLATLSTQFPQHAAAVVSTSLGRWSELAQLTMTQNTQLRRSLILDGPVGNKNESRNHFAGEMAARLLTQADLWLLLLVGARSTSGLLTPESYVTAAEASIRRSARIARTFLQHYWAVLLLVVAAVAGAVYLALHYLGGAAKVWTSIAAVAGTLGISAKSITTAMSRMAADAERPLFGLAQEDAMAWAITTMPQVSLVSSGVRRLRRAGVTPTPRIRAGWLASLGSALSRLRPSRSAQPPDPAS